MAFEPTAVPLAMPSGYQQAGESELLTWTWVDDQLAGAQNYWLATTSPNGAPHVTPIWGIWLHDRLYFDGIPTARWARNSTTNPRAAVHLESGEKVVVLDGSIVDLPRIDDAAIASNILEQWSAKYSRLEPDLANDGLFCLVVRQVRAWTRFPADATKWNLASE